MAHYRGIDGVAREVKKRYRGVDSVAREVKKAYHEVNGVAREYFSSGVRWRKYNCNKKTTYSQYEKAGPHSASKAFYKSNSYDFYYSSMSFSTSSSFSFSGNVDCTDITTWDLSKFQSKLVGKYAKLTDTYCTQFATITSANVGSSSVTINFTEYSYHTSKKTTYSKGTTSYGYKEAPEGELPESGTLIEGSANGSYCIIQVNGTYYYYVKE